jgi:hypothetical protein
VVALSEEALKAGFLFQFTRYVEWPDAAFASPDAPFVIGVAGPQSLSDALEQIVVGKTAGGRPLQVRRMPNVGSPAEWKGCALIFFSAANESPPAGTELALAAPVLTVSDRAGFARDGGMIGFVTAGSRLRLELNGPAADRAGLKISAKLRQLATEVQ